MREIQDEVEGYKHTDRADGCRHRRRCRPTPAPGRPYRWVTEQAAKQHRPPQRSTEATGPSSVPPSGRAMMFKFSACQQMLSSVIGRGCWCHLLREALSRLEFSQPSVE